MRLLKINIKFMFLAMLMMVFSASLKSQDEWKKIEDSEGIKVYARPNSANKLIEVKATMDTEGLLSSFHIIFTDVENYNDWMYSISSAKIVERQNRNNFIYYLVSDFPWPAKDRDAVIQMSIQKQPDDKIIKVKTHSVKDIIPEKKEYQRFNVIGASWECKQTGFNNLTITYHGKIDPGISLPDWLMNNIYALGPFNSMKNLRDLLDE